MADPVLIREALESERKLEQEFVETARKAESAPRGWPAALVIFHMGMWRERLRNGLAAVNEGHDYEPPPANINEFNDEELARGIGTPLIDAAGRSDHLLAEIIELYGALGDRAMDWGICKTTTEAVLRNSYLHPRTHITEYFRENDELERANRLVGETVDELRAAGAPRLVMGAALYNLACCRVGEGRHEDALALLKEAFPMRPDIQANASQDAELGTLRDDPRFQELIKP
jgi:hypothetical protein